jgi:hypothetical protein
VAAEVAAVVHIAAAAAAATAINYERLDGVKPASQILIQVVPNGPSQHARHGYHASRQLSLKGSRSLPGHHSHSLHNGGEGGAVPLELRGAPPEQAVTATVHGSQLL